MMKKIKNAAVLFILAFSMAGASLGQSARFRVTPDAVTKAEAHVAKLGPAGFSGVVTVAVDGKPVISRGYGMSDDDLKLKNSAKTVFDIGSLTKQFTGAAIVKLEMDGKLSTNDKITKYFNDVPADKRESPSINC